MKKPVVTEPDAERDIAEAYEWYEEHRRGLGDEFLLCVEVAFQVIAERPRSFPTVRRKAKRILVHRFPYLILFIEKPDYISVIGVFHTSSDPQRWDDRL